VSDSFVSVHNNKSGCHDGGKPGAKANAEPWKRLLPVEKVSERVSRSGFRQERLIHPAVPARALPEARAWKEKE